MVVKKNQVANASTMIENARADGCYVDPSLPAPQIAVKSGTAQIAEGIQTVGDLTAYAYNLIRTRDGAEERYQNLRGMGYFEALWLAHSNTANRIVLGNTAEDRAISIVHVDGKKTEEIAEGWTPSEDDVARVRDYIAQHPEAIALALYRLAGVDVPTVTRTGKDSLRFTVFED